MLPISNGSDKTTELEKIATDLVGILRHQPAGLITDVDGTISEIVARPEQAVVDPGVRSSLRSLVDKLDLVAVVTGRNVLQAVDLVKIDELVYMGNHGMERRSDGEVRIYDDASTFRSIVESALLEIAREIAIPGVVVEDKGVTGSIHYRGTTDPEHAEREIMRALEPIAQSRGLRITRGRRVIEIRPPVDRNKGTALAELIFEFDLKSCVFMGDDVTDLDAMRVVHRLREAGSIKGATVGVITPETPIEVAETADTLVRGVAEVATVLSHIDQQLNP